MAQLLLKKLEITKGPIDIFSIASKLGIEVRTDVEIPDNEISGLIKRRGKDGNPVVLLNSSHTPQRQRFTLAHELGHFLLHVLDPMHIDRNYVYFRSGSSALAIDPKEIQANQFAAEILMPRDFLLEDLNREKINTDLSNEEILIKQLANDYNVSEQAMTIRIGSLLVS